MKTVVSVDPGETTGIATWNGHYCRSWEVPNGLLAGVRAVRQLLDYNTTLVYEKFEITTSTTRNDLTAAYTTLYINGGLLVAAADAGVLGVHEQRRMHKSFASANNWSTLKAVGWYDTNSTHANDAAAHLLKYLIDARELPDFMLSKIIDQELGL